MGLFFIYIYSSTVSLYFISLHFLSYLVNLEDYIYLSFSIRIYIRLPYILIFWPSKPDSAPVHGDSYEPGLQSSDPEPTQRHHIARTGGPSGSCIHRGA